MYLHYLNKYFLDQSIQETFNLILKTEALVSSNETAFEIQAQLTQQHTEHKSMMQSIHSIQICEDDDAASRIMPAMRNLSPYGFEACSHQSGPGRGSKLQACPGECSSRH